MSVSTNSVSSTPAKILVVDDDKALRSLLGLVLEEEGYAITEAKNGEDCLRLFSHLSPDLVLLDAVMPDMDGFACCEQLRLLPEGQRTPVLMITFLDDEDSIERAFQVGATDYITKPIHWPVLLQRLQRLMVAAQAIAQAEQCQSQLQALQHQHQFHQQILAVAHGVPELTERFTAILRHSLNYFNVTQAIFSYPSQGIFIAQSQDHNSQDHRALNSKKSQLSSQDFSYYPQSFEVLSHQALSPLSAVQADFLAGLQAQTAIAIPLSLRSAPLAYLFLIEPYPRLWQETEVTAFQELGQLLSLMLS